MTGVVIRISNHPIDPCLYLMKIVISPEKESMAISSKLIDIPMASQAP